MPPMGPAKTMRGAEAGIGERHPAEETGDGHVFTSGGVAAVRECGAQGTPSAADAFDAKGIGHGIGARAGVGLDELRQGVETGAGGERGRQVAGEGGVDERNAREHERAAEAHLETMFGRGEDRIARDLGTGAGRGGNGDKGRGRSRKRAAATDDFDVIEQVAVVGQHGGDGFAGVDGAAAAEANHQIAGFFAGKVCAVADGVEFGFAGDAEDGGGEAMFVQEREQRLGAAAIAAGRNESVASEITSQGAGFAKDPGAEDDAGGSGEFEAHGGRFTNPVRRERPRCISPGSAARPSWEPRCHARPGNAGFPCAQREPRRCDRLRRR